MLTGNCWIYMRATLYAPGCPPRIVAYKDGLTPFRCDRVYTRNGYPTYDWNLNGVVVHIPMNVKRHETDSIIQQGTMPLANGASLRWECINGKFERL